MLLLTGTLLGFLGANRLVRRAYLRVKRRNSPKDTRVVETPRFTHRSLEEALGLSDAHLVPFHDERKQAIRRFLKSERFPGFEKIERVHVSSQVFEKLKTTKLEVLFRLIEATCEENMDSPYFCKLKSGERFFVTSPLEIKNLMLNEKDYKFIVSDADDNSYMYHTFACPFKKLQGKQKTLADFIRAVARKDVGYGKSLLGDYSRMPCVPFPPAPFTIPTEPAQNFARLNSKTQKQSSKEKGNVYFSKNTHGSCSRSNSASTIGDVSCASSAFTIPNTQRFIPVAQPQPISRTGHARHVSKAVVGNNVSRDLTGESDSHLSNSSDNTLVNSSMLHHNNTSGRSRRPAAHSGLSVETENQAIYSSETNYVSDDSDSSSCYSSDFGSDSNSASVYSSEYESEFDSNSSSDLSVRTTSNSGSSFTSRGSTRPVATLTTYVYPKESSRSKQNKLKLAVVDSEDKMVKYTGSKKTRKLTC